MSEAEGWLETAENFFGDNDMATAQAAALIAIGHALITPKALDGEETP